MIETEKYGYYHLADDPADHFIQVISCYDLPDHNESSYMQAANPS